jgi:small-conductance mechanosensitive channel
MPLDVIEDVVETNFSPVHEAWMTIVEMGKGFFEHLPYIIVSIAVVLIFMLLSRVAKKAVIKIGRPSLVDDVLVNILSSLAGFAVTIFGVFVAAVILFPDFNASKLIAGLGIGSVAVGFAFKDILQNFFAGLLILWQKPFTIGQQIYTQDYYGTVEDINVRATEIKTFDGQRIVIPNGAIYTNPIKVITAYDQRRTELTIGISYNSPVETARKLIEDVLTNASGVVNDPKPWIYLSEFADSSVNFQVYYWTKPEQAETLRVKNEVMSAIWHAFDEHDIEIPFPQRDLHIRSVDGEARWLVANDEAGRVSSN